MKSTRLLLGLSSIVLFLLSFVNNAVFYTLSFSPGQIDIEAFGEHILLPFTNTDLRVDITFQPQTRYSSPQLLILDRGLFTNITTLIDYSLFRQTSTPFSVTSDARLLHYNPFRASLTLSSSQEQYRLEVNVPDATIEVWRENEKIKTIAISPPWVKLTLLPWLASLFLALSAVFFFISKDTPLSPGHHQKATTMGIWIFLIGALVVGYIFLTYFKAMPGFGDEMNYLVQARIFSQGRLSVPEPSLPEFFKVSWMDLFWNDHKIWNFHPPGNSIILILGWLTGVYWLTVPLVGGAIFASFYYLALRLTNSRWFALLSVFIMGTSHYVLSLTSSFMAHAPSLLFLLLFYLLLLEFILHKSGRHLIYASFFWGLAFLVRPLSAALASIIPLIYGAHVFASDDRKRRPIVIAGITGVAVASLIGIYTYALTDRFTLPYLVKGPEAGQTLIVRLQKPVSYMLANLYRNANEFQHRVHSFGYLFNTFFFFVPLGTFFYLSKHRTIVIVAYLIFFLYLLLHSVMHWYGWKWEPRMIYDISFIFFLLSAYGAWIVFSILAEKKFLRATICVFSVLIYGIFVIGNLRHRFVNEYRQYNFAPAGVKEYVQENHLTDGIIFFKDQNTFAPYAPFNALDFSSGIIYAISQNPVQNYKLINMHPAKPVYYSPDGNQLIKIPSFYERDALTLKKDLELRYPNIQTVVVLPWAALGTDPLDRYFITPVTIVSPESFPALLHKLSGPLLVVFINEANTVSQLIAASSMVQTTPQFQNTVSYYYIPRITENILTNRSGISFHCYPTMSWQPQPIKSGVVFSLGQDQCPGEYVSATWAWDIVMKKPETVQFFLESDDGAALYINNQLILDNGLAEQHATLTNTAAYGFSPGRYHLIIKYTNGPASGFLRAGTIEDGIKKEFSLNSFEQGLLLPSL